MENLRLYPARKEMYYANSHAYELSERIPLKMLAERWLSSLDIMPKSLKSYRSNIKQFFKYLDSQNIDFPNPEDIRLFKKSLEDSDMKSTSINSYITTLKIFFEWTAKHGYYPDVMMDVKLLKVEKGHKKDSLTDDECVRLLLSVSKTNKLKKPEKEKRDFALIWLMLSTGIRTKEAAEADIKDLQQKHGETVLFIRGKGRSDKDRFVVVPDDVLEALKDYFSTRFPDGQIQPDEPLFTKTNNNRITGERMLPSSISRLVKTALRAADLDSDRLTAHSLRHTTANKILEQGGTVREAQQVLGHSQITTTMVYLDDIERRKNQSEKRVANAIASRLKAYQAL